MTQLQEGYHPQLSIEDGTEAAQLAADQFIEGAQQQTEFFKAALEGLIVKPPIAPREPAVQAAHEIIINLLNATDDGFQLDYDGRFINAALRRDSTYLSLIEEHHKTEKEEDRRNSLRAMAARGLWLYIEHS